MPNVDYEDSNCSNLVVLVIGDVLAPGFVAAVLVSIGLADLASL